MIIKTANSIHIVLDFLKTQTHVAFDIETTGLSPRVDKVIGFGVSNATEGYYVCHLEFNNDTQTLEERVSKDDCLKILEVLSTLKWVGHNSSFEVRFIHAYFGLDLRESLWSDSMLAKHTADEDRPFALKDIGKMLYGESAVEERDVLKGSLEMAGSDKSHYYKADVDILGNYCIKDCLLTYKINNHYLNILKDEGSYKFFLEDEVIPMYKYVVIGMEERGVCLDIDLINRTKHELDYDLGVLEADIQNDISPFLDKFNQWYLNKTIPPKKTGEFAQYLCMHSNLNLPKTKSGRYSMTTKNLESLGDSEAKRFLLHGNPLSSLTVSKVQELWISDQPNKFIFNLSSKDHLKRLYFDKLQETPISFTDTGQPQVDEMFLAEMSKKYEWTMKLRNYNKLIKLKGTYIDRFLEKQEKGIYYPSWFMHKTISGRLGGDLMQLPRIKEDSELDPLVLKYNNKIREFIISAPGKCLIGADYESLEPKAFAAVANDEGLKRIFKDNLDFYSYIAIQTENIKNASAIKTDSNFLGKINKPLRQKSKAYCLGVPYGLGDYALSKKLEISQKEAGRLIDNYLNAFPKLKQWMEDSYQKCITEGTIRTQTGRVRHMPLAVKYYDAYGDKLLDSLHLHQKYSDNPAKYKQMKWLRNELKNYINNARNFQIQGLAASITNRACVAIAKEIKRINADANIVMQIHDEIVIECSEKDVDRLSKSVRYLMENTYKISVPLIAIPQIGKRYSDVK